jgi:hypothetical protein
LYTKSDSFNDPTADHISKISKEEEAGSAADLVVSVRLKEDERVDLDLGMADLVLDDLTLQLLFD